MNGMVMMNNGDFVSEEAARLKMGVTEVEWRVMRLTAEVISDSMHAHELPLQVSAAIAMLTDRLFNDLFKARTTTLPVEAVQKEFGIGPDEAKIVGYYIDASSTAMALAAVDGHITPETGRQLAIEMTARLRASFAAQLDTIGEVAGHA